MSDDITTQRINALLKAEPGMSLDQAKRQIHRWERGRQAPSIKQVGRILKKAGLDRRG